MYYTLKQEQKLICVFITILNDYDIQPFINYMVAGHKRIREHSSYRLRKYPSPRGGTTLDKKDNADC